MIWVGIAAAMVLWLLGLLFQVGAVVHLLLIAAGVLLAVQVIRDRPPA
jgi:hypothetical protein